MMQSFRWVSLTIFSHQETSMKPHEAHQMPQHGPNIDLTLLNIGQGNDRIIRILMMQSFRWVSLTFFPIKKPP